MAGGVVTSRGTRRCSAATSSRPRCRRSRRVALRYGATEYAVYRSRDDRYKFLQIGDFEDKLDFERYWYGEEFVELARRLLELVPGAGRLRLVGPHVVRRARAGGRAAAAAVRHCCVRCAAASIRRGSSGEP